jgi:hypothetical protein
MGGLIAQRLSQNNSRITMSSQNTGNTGASSSTTFAGFYGGGSKAAIMTTNTVVSRVDTGLSKERSHPYDAELNRIDNEEKAHVRVNWEFDRREEFV